VCLMAPYYKIKTMSSATEELNAAPNTSSRLRGRSTPPAAAAAVRGTRSMPLPLSGSAGDQPRPRPAGKKTVQSGEGAKLPHPLCARRHPPPLSLAFFRARPLQG